MISSNRLEPGSIGRIQTSVDTTGKSGVLVKKISIYSNDPISPVSMVMVTMDIIAKPSPESGK